MTLPDIFRSFPSASFLFSLKAFKRIMQMFGSVLIKGESFATVGIFLNKGGVIVLLEDLAILYIECW